MEKKLLYRTLAGFGLLVFCLFLPVSHWGKAWASEFPVHGNGLPASVMQPAMQDNGAQAAAVPVDGEEGENPAGPNSDTPQDETDTVEYTSIVVAKRNRVMLALYNSLSAPVDEDSLVALAQHCYGEVGGNLYERVLINWYLPGQPKGAKPWAVSNFSKDMQVVEILDDELVKKFPSIKRWQQPGHEPLIR